MADEEETFDPLKFKLSKPIMANGEMIAEINFREPTGGDIERCGVPVTFRYLMEDQSVEVKTDGRAMTQMMSQLAGIPPSSIKLLSAQDWISLSWGLQRFFQPR
jgi:hypothetical protein